MCLWLKVYHFIAKDSEIKPHPLCLGNLSKDFTVDNLKKTGLKGITNFFSVDYRFIDTNEILDDYKYLTKELL